MPSVFYLPAIADRKRHKKHLLDLSALRSDGQTLVVTRANRDAPKIRRFSPDPSTKIPTECKLAKRWQELSLKTSSSFVADLAQTRLASKQSKWFGPTEEEIFPDKIFPIKKSSKKKILHEIRGAESHVGAESRHVANTVKFFTSPFNFAYGNFLSNLKKKDYETEA